MYIDASGLSSRKNHAQFNQLLSRLGEQRATSGDSQSLPAALPTRVHGANHTALPLNSATTEQSSETQPQQANQPARPGYASHTQTSYSHYESMERYSSSIENKLEFSIATQEGDIITIKADYFEQESEVTYARVQSAESSSYLRQGQHESYVRATTQSAQLVTEQTSELELSFSVAVIGDLNESEAAAVNELLTDMRTYTDELFAGETNLENEIKRLMGDTSSDNDAATSALVDLFDYDTATIAGFDLQVSQSKIEEYTNLYKEVQGFTEQSMVAGSHPSPPPLPKQTLDNQQANNELKALLDFLKMQLEQQNNVENTNKILHLALTITPA